MRQVRIGVAWLGTVLLAVTAVKAQQTIGLFINDERAFQGYTLVAPLSSKTTYLINNDGLVVHSWTGDSVHLVAYLLPNGHLLRHVATPVPANFSGSAGGNGRIEEVDWDGTLVWSYEISDNTYFSHHDIEPMPNGNVLVNVWRYHTNAEAIAEGHNPATLGGAIWSDSIFELEPNHPGASVVWEWHVWDHLVQNFDPLKNNYGVVADHPELVDLNFGTLVNTADWNHANTVKYNAALDQVIWSSRVFSEVYVIDHSTTTAEAAGHTGGRSGKGGDILYRWGNPLAYQRGVSTDQRLFFQHDIQWIAPGRPGAGNLLVFNNGNQRPGPDFSSVDEIVTPIPDGNGDYPISSGQPYGPTGATWSYSETPASFFAGFISGAERQPNGNTLIINGPAGILFEVMPDGTQVWRYVNATDGQVPETQGTVPAVNDVFKARRYAPDYPGLVGKTLTPGDPIEIFDRPHPVTPTSLQASRTTASGDQIQLSWDATSCPSDGYNLLYGGLDDVSTHDLGGAVCGIGLSGSYGWTGVPAGSLYYVVVGRDSTGIYESSWGLNGSGGQRNGTRASFLCGATTKVVTSTCP